MKSPGSSSKDSIGDCSPSASARTPPVGRLPLAVWAMVRWFALVGCVLLIGVPVSGGLDRNAGTLVLILSSVFGGMLLFLAGFIALFAMKWSKDLEALRLNHFIHWTYTQDEWHEYIDNETKRGRWFPLIVFACFAVIGWITAGLIAAESESDPGLIAVILLGVGGGSTVAGAVFAAVIRVFTKRQLAIKRKRGGLTLIGAKGLYIGGDLWRWRGAGQIVKNIDLETEPRLRLRFTFLVNAGDTTTDKTVYVPVPSGCDNEAQVFINKTNAIVAS